MKHLIIVFLSLTLIACGGPLPERSHRVVDWQQQVTAVSKLTHWQNRGSIGIKSDDDGFNASFAWIQSGSNYDFTISAPIGSQSMQVKGEPGTVILLLEDEAYTASSPETLVSTHFGWFIPVSNIKYWVRALPVPNLPYEEEFDTQNRLYVLKQDNWQILYQDYTEIGSLILPTRMTLTTPGLRIRLIIRRWQLNE